MVWNCDHGNTPQRLHQRKDEREKAQNAMKRLTKSTSQMQSVPSLEPVASLLPSGEKRQNQTSSLCWVSTCVVLHGNCSLNTRRTSNKQPASPRLSTESTHLSFGCWEQLTAAAYNVWRACFLASLSRCMELIDRTNSCLTWHACL